MIDFNERQRERQQKIDAWSKSADDIQKQMDALKAREQDAMAAGDADELAGIIAEQRTMADRLDAYRKLIENCPPPWTDEEIFQAWSECAADHNKRFGKVYDKYLKAMRQMFDLYVELVDIQHDTGKVYAAMKDRLSTEGRQNAMAKIDTVRPFMPQWRTLLAPVMNDSMKDIDLAQRGLVPLDIGK